MMMTPVDQLTDPSMHRKVDAEGGRMEAASLCALVLNLLDFLGVVQPWPAEGRKVRKRDNQRKRDGWQRWRHFE